MKPQRLIVRPVEVYRILLVWTAISLAPPAATPADLEARAAPPECSNKETFSDFEQAMWCVRKKQWLEAVPWLVRAIDVETGRPQADADHWVRLYGKLNKYPYLPYFYLGRCFYEAPDCLAALEAFEKSIEQAQVQRIEKLCELLKEQRGRCWASQPANSEEDRSANSAETLICGR